MNMFIRFLREEDGLGTVELVVIIAVLLGVALLFRKQLFDFVQKVLNSIFNGAEAAELQKNPLLNPNPPTNP